MLTPQHAAPLLDLRLGRVEYLQAALWRGIVAKHALDGGYLLHWRQTIELVLAQSLVGLCNDEKVGEICVVCETKISKVGEKRGRKPTSICERFHKYDLMISNNK